MKNMLRFLLGSCYLMIGLLSTQPAKAELLEGHVIGNISMNTTPVIEGKFSQAVDLSNDSRHIKVPLNNILEERPVTFTCWMRFNDFNAFNILMSVAPKSGRHWEIYTQSEQVAHLKVYIPQQGDFDSGVKLEKDRWYYVAFRLMENGFDLYLDGEVVISKEFEQPLRFDDEPLLLGRIHNEVLSCNGAIEDLHITRGEWPLAGYVPTGPTQVNAHTIALFHFDDIASEERHIENAMTDNVEFYAEVMDNLAMPVGDRFLDEAQDERYAQSTLHGCAAVEAESNLPVRQLVASMDEPTQPFKDRTVMSLNGTWKMKGSETGESINKRLNQFPNVKESQGVLEGWFREGFDKSDWFTVEVPTSVQNALLKLGEIENPFWDDTTYNVLMNEGWPEDFAWHFRKTPVERQDWWFSRTFEVPQDWQDKQIRLYFDGIDYEGSVYLNGMSLGHHEGMFGGPERDVSRMLHYDRPNELVVRVDAARDSWYGILKGSPGWGWHYGRMISMGIWRDVELQVIPEVSLEAPFVKTQSISDTTASIAMEYYLHNANPEPVTVTVTGHIQGITFNGESIVFTNEVTVPYGQSRFETEISVENPRLWWPMNYGDQDLYTLDLVVTSEEMRTPMDGKQVRFGIRTIEMHPLRGTQPESDYRWQFVINGTPIFMKGANWCWTDPLLQVNADKYEHILELARRGGIMMFRSWGGGIVETDEFYEKCDEKGLLIYQEFPYCWGPPDFPHTNPATLDDQVSRVIKRLRNHPSLIMWGGGNENVHIDGNDEGLFLVGRRCRQYDPTRPFHRTSPWGGSAHNWGVFHQGNPIDSGFVDYPAVFYGEFGMPTMSNFDEIQLSMPAEKLNDWPPNEGDGGWLMHLNQFSYRDIVKVLRYADYGPVDSWKKYIEYGQVAQGDEVFFATNLQRQGSYFNKGGLWFYKMTELFPGQSWGVVGFYGHPKLSYYRIKHAIAPQAAYAFYNKYDWEPGEPFEATLHVNNDSNMRLDDVTVTAILYGSDWSVVWQHAYIVDHVPFVTRYNLDTLKIDIPETVAKPFLLAIAMRDQAGNLISDQWNWFNFRAKTELIKELEALGAWGFPEDRVQEAMHAYAALPEARLLTMPPTNLRVAIQRDGVTGVLLVENITDTPALNVLIEQFPHQYGAFLEDNLVSLYPGEKREIAFELPSMETDLSLMTIKAWNAEAVKPLME